MLQRPVATEDQKIATLAARRNAARRSPRGQKTRLVAAGREGRRPAMAGHHCGPGVHKACASRVSRLTNSRKQEVRSCHSRTLIPAAFMRTDRCPSESSTRFPGRRRSSFLSMPTACRCSSAVGMERNELLLDRKSTRLNSSHVSISYAVFCLKKKTTTTAATCHVRG